MNTVLDITGLTRAENTGSWKNFGWIYLDLRPNMNRQSGMVKCFERVKRMSRLAGMSLCRGRKRSEFFERAQ
nr:hypothetical protein [Desulfonatronum lacustre]